MEESEEIPNTDGLYGVNVTAELNALNPKKLIKAGFLDTDGVYHVSTEDDWMNMDDPLWIESTDFTTVVSSTSKLDVLKQLERYRPKTITKEATKTTPKKEFNPSSYRNSKSATGKKISDVVYNKEDKTYKVSYYGEKPETLSQEEWDKLEGGLQSAPPKMKKEQ
jgi:hypothetical protein